MSFLQKLKAPLVRNVFQKFKTHKFINFQRRTVFMRSSVALRLRIGDEAPNFDCETTKGKLNFHEYLGNTWGILFSHPADFTPVCTTELGIVEKLRNEWNARNVKVIALSCDTVEDHHKWIRDIVETQSLNYDELHYPIIGDKDRKIAEKYDMLDQTNINKEGLPATVRSVYIISPDKKIRLTLTYPASTGRNFNEILRVTDSLQLTDNYKVATPGNWHNGDACVILPSVSDENAKKMFTSGFVKKKSYLREVAQPNLGYTGHIHERPGQGKV